jgi:type I restriction enzyme M protein
LKTKNGAKKRDSGELAFRDLQLLLLQAADILRVTVRRESYCSYVLPLLLFKRFSDLYDEEQLELNAEYKNEQTARIKSHHFMIPEGCLWQDVITTPGNIGQTLNITLTRIAEANPSLSGVINRTDFAKQEQLPQETLAKLMEHFSRLRLSNIDVTWETLGTVCEYLIRKFTEAAAEQVGQFYTPREVTRTMVEILAPDEANAVYDPCCGSGGTLVESCNYLKRLEKNPAQLSLYGQEINGDTWAIGSAATFGRRSVFHGSFLTSDAYTGVRSSSTGK